MKNYHLVILKKPYVDAILTGRKKIESRLFKTRHPAFGKVLAGDTLFLKVSSGAICGKAVAGDVKYFENLTRQKIADLKQKYNHQILGPDEYWQSKSDCKFAFLVWLKDIRPIEPVRIDKKDWRAWVVLTKSRNFGLLPFKA